MKKVLVVGAGSCLSVAICKQLYKNYDFVGTYNKSKPNNIFFSKLLKIDFLSPKIYTPASFFDDADDILFFIGSYLPKYNDNQVYKSNYSTLKNFLKIYKKYNIKSRIIYISSTSVYAGNNSTVINEKSKKSPSSVYGKAKIEAESLLIKSGAPYIIIRPTTIYGKSFTKTFIELKKNLKNKKLFLYGTGNNNCSYCFENDLVKVIKKIIDLPITSIDFNIVNPPITQKKFVNSLAKLFDINKINSIPIEDTLKDNNHPFSKSLIKRFSRDCIFDTTKVKKELRIKLTNQFSRAIKETFKN